MQNKINDGSPRRLKPTIPRSVLSSVFRWAIVFLATAFLCLYDVTTSTFSLAYMRQAEYWQSLGLTSLFMIVIAFLIFDDFQTKTLFKSRRVMLFAYQIDGANNAIKRLGLSGGLDDFIAEVNRDNKYRVFIARANMRIERLKNLSPVALRVYKTLKVDIQSKKERIEADLKLSAAEVWEKRTVKRFPRIYRSQLFGSAGNNIKVKDGYDFSSHKPQVQSVMVGKKLGTPIALTAILGLLTSTAVGGGFTVAMGVAIGIKLINILFTIIVARDGGIGYVLDNVMAAYQSKHDFLSDFAQRQGSDELKTVLNTTLDEFNFSE